jgi:hypothetical protein
MWRIEVVRWHAGSVADQGEIWPNFWAGLFRSVELAGRLAQVKPPECGNKHFIVRPAFSDAPFDFAPFDFVSNWPDSREMRVLWDKAEAGCWEVYSS